MYQLFLHFEFLYQSKFSFKFFCENTHLCNSLHQLLTPRRELMCGRIEREAGSQGNEQKHNYFVVKTQSEDGERVTLCG